MSESLAGVRLHPVLVVRRHFSLFAVPSSALVYRLVEDWLAEQSVFESQRLAATSPLLAARLVFTVFELLRRRSKVSTS